MRTVTEEDIRLPEFRHAKLEDLEFRADGKIVRKDRWETGIRRIANRVEMPSGNWEIEEVVNAVQQAQKYADMFGWVSNNLQTLFKALQNREELNADDFDLIEFVNGKLEASDD